MRWRRALAMNPVAFFVRDGVVSRVPGALGIAPEQFKEALREQFSIRTRPTHRQIMPAKVMRTRGGLVAMARFAFQIGAEDRFAEAARSAVDQKEHAVGGKSTSLEVGGFKHFVDLLQLGEMVPSAKRPHRVVEARRRQAFVGKEI